MKIKNNTFIVTGGASGLGESTIRQLYNSGANVVLFDMDSDRGDEIVKELGNDRCLFIKTDITSEESVNNALEKVIGKFKEIRGVVCCAGIAIAIRTVTSRSIHPLDVFSKVLDVNIAGTFNVIRLSANLMKSNSLIDGEKGVFVMVASVAAYDGQQGQAAYSASKGGIVSMTLPLAREFASLQMRVMTVAPGIFATPMVTKLPEPAIKSIEATVPFPSRLGNSTEFSSLVEHILQNTYLNGEVIRLDGAVRLSKL